MDTTDMTDTAPARLLLLRGYETREEAQVHRDRLAVIMERGSNVLVTVGQELPNVMGLWAVSTVLRDDVRERGRHMSEEEALIGSTMHALCNPIVQGWVVDTRAAREEVRG
jgi:endo-alpha-1,4-polygalactosaminidase (GH114 family)